MSSQLGLKDYLENLTDSSSRVKFTTIVLVVVTVLVVAGNLSIGTLGWMDSRIKTREKMVIEIDEKIAELKQSINNGATERVSDSDFELPISCGTENCDLDFSETGDLLNSTKKRLACYECAKHSSLENLKMTIRARVENFTVKLPFFGVVFDSNDVTLLGGVSFIIVLLMLRLGLRSYIISLRICIKAALKSDEPDKFYEIAASRQLFVFPYLEDKNQVAYFGETESLWRDSPLSKFINTLFAGFTEFKECVKNFLWRFLNSLFLLKEKGNTSSFHPALTILLLVFFILLFILIPKMGIFYFIALSILLSIIAYISYTIIKIKSCDFSQQDSIYKDYWSINPQPWLKRIPKLFSLTPCVIYGISLAEDFDSLHIGLLLNPYRTATGFTFCFIFLFVIIGLSFWCVSKWSEIDFLWIDFFEKAYKNNGN